MAQPPRKCFWSGAGDGFVAVSTGWKLLYCVYFT